MGSVIFELKNAGVDGMEQIERFEAGDGDGDVIFGCEGLIVVVACDGADVTCGEKSLSTGGVLHEPVHGWEDLDMGREDGEVFELQSLGFEHGECCGRGSGFEADSEEDDFVLRVLSGVVDGIDGGVDGEDVSADGLSLEE